MTSLTKKLKPKSKIFLHRKHKELPNHLRVWTALLCNRRWRCSCTKACGNCWILALATQKSRC